MHSRPETFLSGRTAFSIYTVILSRKQQTFSAAREIKREKERGSIYVCVCERERKKGRERKIHRKREREKAKDKVTAGEIEKTMLR